MFRFVDQLVTASVKAGKKIITERKLSATPLAKWIPKSFPMPNRMNNKAEKPIIVVAALAATVGNARLMANCMAHGVRGKSGIHQNYVAENSIVQRNGKLQTGLTVCVIKDISLKSAAGTMLMSTAIPMVNKKQQRFYPRCSGNYKNNQDNWK